MHVLLCDQEPKPLLMPAPQTPALLRKEVASLHEVFKHNGALIDSAFFDSEVREQS